MLLRRAAGARGPLAAVALTVLLAAALCTAVLALHRDAGVRGARAAVAAAPPAARSVLVHRPGTAGDDAAVRAALAGVGPVAGARYGSGRALARAADGYAALLTADDLPAHATLAAGAWPDGTGAAPGVALPAAVAAGLRLRVGDRVPLTDRATGRASAVLVVGVWTPRDPADPYWRLLPAALDAAPGRTTSWPFPLAAADFDRLHPAGAGAGWVADARFPAGGDAAAAAAVAAGLPAAGGRAAAAAGSGARAETDGAALAARLAVVGTAGRAALLGPVALLVMLSGYTLLLLGALLHDARWRESALLRARGATRRQLAGWAVAEAAVFVVPVALLAPAATAAALRALDPAGGLWSAPPFGPASRLVGGGFAVLAVIALAVPALRVGDRYVNELAAHARPTRFGAAHRAGLDLALAAAAVLAWYALRDRPAPTGADLLLVAAPTLAVLAGAALALRLAPPLIGLAERFVDRRDWSAVLLGIRQVARRPHAGPLLLLAAGVAVSALTWSTVATWQRSLADRADAAVGADLRLTAVPGPAPAGRPAAIAALPGARAVLPVRRGSERIGAADGTSVLLALDARAAVGVVRGPGADLLPALAAARPAPGGPVPALATPALLRDLRIGVGQQAGVPLAGRTVPALITGTVEALPGAPGAARGLLLDAPALAGHLPGADAAPTEWWLAADGPAAAAAAADLPGLTVLDRRAVAAANAADPSWRAARAAYLVVGFGALLIALAGFTVDARAGSRRRLGGLAVLHALGARPRWLARAVVTEQTLLVGVGVAAGLAIGAVVATALAPLVILTPAAERPVPAPALVLPWPALAGTGAAVLLAAALLSAATAARARRDLPAAARRIGDGS
ncbi:hypothetical protein GCM10010123_25020 [Pilimelia anulata]|uniref:ABC3 transporter permease C-terminal domain-containing protein n=1 Tax=Pilimelia anulata TaxID=53371 RepID=A0A8J3B530_9ACTN|nr:FtsX-like permease family protein [Pilimelia anulata]GGJ94156.1 hypothetical protein GCM10010123_25020 [Pilimelia anulata]